MVERTARRGGTVVIPAFAVDRTEIVLFHLARLIAAGRIPPLPVLVDSPMALASLAVYRRAVGERWPELRPELYAQGDPFDTGTLQEAHDVEHSKAIDQIRYPTIVVSAAGMATGGRILHHLAARLPDPRNAIVLVGFQAEGTRGRQLEQGSSTPCTGSPMRRPTSVRHWPTDSIAPPSPPVTSNEWPSAEHDQWTRTAG